MRLSNVYSGHSPEQMRRLEMIRGARGGALPDVVRMLQYRPEYFGGHLSALIHEALRGPSEWSPCERELFASFTARLGDCVF